MKSFRYRSYRPETSNKHSSQIRIRGAFKERHLSALWDNLEPRAMLTKLLRNLKMDCVVWVVHLLNTHFLGSVSCMSFFIRNNSYGSLDFREVAFSSCSPRQVLTFVLGSKGGVCLKAMGTCRSGNRAVVIMNSSCLTVLSLVWTLPICLVCFQNYQVIRIGEPHSNHHKFLSLWQLVKYAENP